MDQLFLQKLSQNLLEILDDDEHHDVIIEVGNDPNVKIFRAHMIILNYRSPYLKRILSTNRKKNDDESTSVNIKLSNILPETFQIILRYIYGGVISLKGCNLDIIIKILDAAKELGLQELISHLESFLIKKKKWMETNFNLIYQISSENDSFLKLQKYCTDLITKNSDKIFKSKEFTSISEKLLISIIQNGNLKMSEIQVWDHVIKWGLSQNPELSSNPKTFSDDDFNILKNTLQRCIPLINFRKLTSKEFSKKVLPYEKIFPQELLYDELFNDFLNNNSKQVQKSDDDSSKSIEKSDDDSKKIEKSDDDSKQIDEKSDDNWDHWDNWGITVKEIDIIDSKIITSKHAEFSELISKWINRLEITDKLISPYKFKLLFRGSRDGFTAEGFHGICDYQYRTVLFIKVGDENEILGGYNPIKWKFKGGHGATKDSFIFSFKKSDNIENYILSRVENEERAIYNAPDAGPSFDDDLCLYDSYDSIFGGLFVGCMKKTYEKPIREDDNLWHVKECEVFQIEEH